MGLWVLGLILMIMEKKLGFFFLNLINVFFFNLINADVENCGNFRDFGYIYIYIYIYIIIIIITSMHVGYSIR